MAIGDKAGPKAKAQEGKECGECVFPLRQPCPRLNVHGVKEKEKDGDESDGLGNESLVTLLGGNARRGFDLR